MNAGPDLSAHVVIDKYVDPLPLYRQARRRAAVPLNAGRLGPPSLRRVGALARSVA